MDQIQLSLVKVMLIKSKLFGDFITGRTIGNTFYAIALFFISSLCEF